MPGRKGRSGRKPKPDHLKLVEGTARPDRMNPNAPKPERGIPDPPMSLDREGKKAWRLFCEILDPMGVLTVADGPALLMLVDTFSEWHAARRRVRRLGMTFDRLTFNKKGEVLATTPVRRPEVAIAADAMRRAAGLMASFGLTPADRTRVSKAGTGDDEFDAFLNGGNG